MLIFVAGHHPIYGRQMLYFTDPVLRARSAVESPTKLITLVDGKSQLQLPLARTAHVMSRPEELSSNGSEAPVSPMEAAFQREMYSPAAEPGTTAKSKLAPIHQTALPEAYFEELDTTHTSQSNPQRSTH